MAGYIIAQIDVRDSDAYDEYKALVPGTIAPYEGEFLVRGGDVEVLEGELVHPRIVVIRFPSVEQARAWYESDVYVKPKAMRQAASRGHLYLVSGD